MKVRTSFLPILSAAVLLSGTRTGAQTPSNAITLSVSPDAAQVKQKIALTANVTSDGIAGSRRNFFWERAWRQALLCFVNFAFSSGALASRKE